MTKNRDIYAFEYQDDPAPKKPVFPARLLVENEDEFYTLLLALEHYESNFIEVIQTTRDVAEAKLAAVEVVTLRRLHDRFKKGILECE